MATSPATNEMVSEASDDTVTAEVSGSYYEWLGRDAKGRFHHYDKQTNTVYMTETEQEQFLPDGAGIFWFRLEDVVRVEQLDDYDDKDVDDWRAFVDGGCGWSATPTNITSALFGATEDLITRGGR